MGRGGGEGKNAATFRWMQVEILSGPVQQMSPPLL